MTGSAQNLNNDPCSSGDLLDQEVMASTCCRQDAARHRHHAGAGCDRLRARHHQPARPHRDGHDTRRLFHLSPWEPDDAAHRHHRDQQTAGILVDAVTGWSICARDRGSPSAMNRTRVHPGGLQPQRRAASWLTSTGCSPRPGPALASLDGNGTEHDAHIARVGDVHPLAGVAAASARQERGTQARRDAEWNVRRRTTRRTESTSTNTHATRSIHEHLMLTVA